jgi:hypothetical protein
LSRNPLFQARGQVRDWKQHKVAEVINLPIYAREGVRLGGH